MVERELIEKLGSKVDKLITAVQAQNTILAEHSQYLKSLGLEISTLRAVQQSHGGEIEKLTHAFRQIQLDSVPSRAQALTPVPKLDPELLKGRGR